MPQISGPTRAYRVVQIHPLLKCNLRCLHCYSESSPTQLPSLGVDRLCSALDVLQREGFNGVGLSGGEPLLYADLPRLLGHIRALGMIATVTTNAMLIDADKAAMLRELTDLVAISVDGPRDSHNRLRAHPRAFEMMGQGTAHLRDAGVPFGFIFTLTLHNLFELRPVVEFAIAEGATLLQVHPLEEVGRATAALRGSAPDSLELARAFVEVAHLQHEFAGRLVIQYDVADLEVLSASPERGYAMEPCDDACSLAAAGGPLADVLAPIVIEADGAIVPLQYNFARAFQIADLNAGRLVEQLDAWKREHFREFLALCRAVYLRLVGAGTPPYPFVNWYGAMLAASHAAAADTAAPLHVYPRQSGAVSA
jgi:MoaA/NifB/PqqE/SkfB family radical SAM enzyme